MFDIIKNCILNYSLGLHLVKLNTKIYNAYFYLNNITIPDHILTIKNRLNQQKNVV